MSKTKSKDSNYLVLRQNDYVVLRPEGGTTKYSLVKITDPSPTSKGLLESQRKGLRVEAVQFKAEQILLNLGPKPEPGKVYGLDLVNRFRRKLDHDFWGNVLLFTSLDAAQTTLIRKSLDRTAQKIEKMGLGFYVDFVDTHLCAKQGKWAGRYCHNAQASPDGDTTPSIIKYAPECAELQPKAMDYIVYHEFGHVVRFNGVTGKKLRMKWLTEYLKSVEAFEITQAQLRILFKHLSSYIDGEQPLSTVLREFLNEDEEHALWVRGLLRWFREVHHLNPKELAIIWDNNDAATLKDLWPTGSIDSSKLSPVVTEYSMVNVEELFAESFAFYCQGKKLPARIEQLVENSIQYAKALAKKE